MSTHAREKIAELKCDSPRRSAPHESLSPTPLLTMHTQEDLAQQCGTTDDQQKPPSEAAVPSSPRGSFLALRIMYDLKSQTEDDDGTDVQPWTKSSGMAPSAALR
jgi:hypothetical protein